MTDVVWSPYPPSGRAPRFDRCWRISCSWSSRVSVPTWEVRRQGKKGGGDSDLVVGGADTFEAAKAAALFEATARSPETGFLAETDLSFLTITGPCTAARRRSSLLGRPAVAPAGRSSSGSALLGYNNRRPDWDAAAVGCKSEHMTDVVWQPLPPLWPSPAVSTDVGGFMLLVFTEDSVPTWEVRRKAKRAAATAIWSLAAPRTHSKRLRQRRCLKRRPGPQDDETI